MTRMFANGRSHSPWSKGILIPLWATQLTLLSAAIVLLSLSIRIYVKDNSYTPKWTEISLGLAALVLFITGTETIIFVNGNLSPKYFLYSSIAKEIFWTIPLVFNILALTKRYEEGKWLYAIIGIGLNSALYITFFLQILYSLTIHRRSRNYALTLHPNYHMTNKSLPSIITTTVTGTSYSTTTNQTDPEANAAEMQPLYYENYRGAAPTLPELRITEASPISSPHKSLEIQDAERPRSLALSSHPTITTSSFIPTLQRYASISEKMGPVYKPSGGVGKDRFDADAESVYGGSWVEGDDHRRSWVGGDDGDRDREEKIIDVEAEAQTYRSLITTSLHGEITRGWSVKSQESVCTRPGSYP